MSEEATAVKEFDADIKELGDKLAGLSLKQAVDVTEYLKEAYGIEPAAGGGAMMMAPGAGGGGAAVEEEVEEQTEFDVILKEAGGQKIKVIKVVREVTGLGLKEAKALVDEAPKPVKEKVSKEEAEELKGKLEAEGATIEIK